MKGNDKNWIQRHPVWTGLIAFFGIIMVFSILGSMIVSVGEKQIDDATGNNYIKSNTMSEADYLMFIIEFAELEEEMLNSISDISYSAANGLITLDDAGRLFGEYANIFEKAEINLKKMNVPSKFILPHKHFINAQGYLKDAMKLARDGSYLDNVDLIIKSTQKMYLAGDEIEIATSYLK